jgi:adenylate kinase family enzyme
LAPKRINVIGTSGSGKSTFARKLSSKLGAPYFELDAIFWKPNWTEPTDEELFAKLREALDRPAWVLDGNYSRTNSIKWEKADMVIWLDYSFRRTLLQAVTRAIRRAWTKEELWAGTGNRESFRGSFLSRKSIIWWTIRQHAPTREKNLRLIADSQKPGGKYAHVKFVRLTSHRDADRFLLEF